MRNPHWCFCWATLLCSEVHVFVHVYHILGNFCVGLVFAEFATSLKNYNPVFEIHSDKNRHSDNSPFRALQLAKKGLTKKITSFYGHFCQESPMWKYSNIQVLGVKECWMIGGIWLYVPFLKKWHNLNLIFSYENKGLAPSISLIWMSYTSNIRYSALQHIASEFRSLPHLFTRHSLMWGKFHFLAIWSCGASHCYTLSQYL